MRALTITWLRSFSIRPLYVILLCLYKEKHKINKKSSKKSLKVSNCYKTFGRIYICNPLSELWSILFQSCGQWPQLSIMAATVSENRIKIDTTPSKVILTNHAKNQLLSDSIELTHVVSTFGFLVDNPNRQNNMSTTVVLYAN